MRPIAGTITDPAVDRSHSPSTKALDLLELARALAKVAHASQARWNGEPYFNHVDRVAKAAGRARGVRAATLGYLHDLVEDTRVTLIALSRVGFPHYVVRDVDALTHEWAEGGTYAEYIRRLISEGSDDALQVKLADLADNLTGQTKESLARRYRLAQCHIEAELKRRARQ